MSTPSPTPCKLVAIGGGAIPEEVTAEIVRLGGGPDARIVVCPLASDDPTTGEYIAEHRYRMRHGATNVHVFDFLDPSRYDNEDGSKRPSLAEMRAFANSPESLVALNNTDVFYFAGGDQRTILSTLHGTLFASELIERWRRGQVVIAGTSAGLQIQSELAFTGDFRFPEENSDQKGSDTPCPLIAKGVVEIIPGLGLIKGVILDQHFLARRRQNRLISAVIDHPSYLGVGVDESTALVFEGVQGSEVRPRIIGKSGVFYVDARQATIECDRHDRLLRVEGMNCGVVWAGGAFPYPIRLSGE